MEPSSISPAASAVVAASQPSPRCSAARHNSPGSPNGSAAATVRKRRASVGNDRILFAKPSSRWPANPLTSEAGTPSINSAVVHARGSSTSASGFPPRLRHDPVAQPGIGRPGHHRIEQHRRIGVAQTIQPQLRETDPISVVDRIPSADHKRHRLGEQPARHKRNCLHRHPVEPLSVVHDTQHRLLLRERRDQLQHGETDKKPVRRRTSTETERRAERIALRPGQVPHPVTERPAQLLQPGIRQLHLRLDTDRGAQSRNPCALRTASSRSTDFPIPASPRTTTTPLRPRASVLQQHGKSVKLPRPPDQRHVGSLGRLSSSRCSITSSCARSFR